MRYSGKPPAYSASRPVSSSHSRSATQEHLSRVINSCLSVLMLVCCLDVHCFEEAHNIHVVSVDMTKDIWKSLLVSDNENLSTPSVNSSGRISSSTTDSSLTFADLSDVL